MKKENKSLLIKWLICFGVAALITCLVILIRGMFTPDLEMKIEAWTQGKMLSVLASTIIQLLADGFSVSGLLMTLVAGLLFVSGEGAFIGIGFIARSVVLTFLPMGRKKHELYKDYRERKMQELKKQNDICILVSGLSFLFIGIVFNVIWLVFCYNKV